VELGHKLIQMADFLSVGFHGYAIVHNLCMSKDYNYMHVHTYNSMTIPYCIWIRLRVTVAIILV